MDLSSAFTTEVNGDLVILSPPTIPVYTFIWLHGVGQSSDDFMDLFTSTTHSILPQGKTIKVIMVNAPQRPVNVYGNKEMQSWYNMTTTDNGKTIIRDDSQVESST